MRSFTAQSPRPAAVGIEVAAWMAASQLTTAARRLTRSKMSAGTASAPRRFRRSRSLSRRAVAQTAWPRSIRRGTRCRPSAPVAPITAMRMLADDDAGVHDAGRVEHGFRRGEGGAEQLRPLALVPFHVVAPDRVVMRDGAAVGDDRIGRGLLDLHPLLQ